MLVLDAKSEAAVRGAVPQANLVRLPNPVDTEAVDAVAGQVPASAASDGRIRLVYVGHLIPAKGLRELVAACAGLPELGLTLDVVGPGNADFVAELRRIAAERGPADWLRFRGRVGHDAAIRSIVGGDVLVLPSYSEGMPNVVLEAMACRRPVLATTAGAIAEMLDADGGRWPAFASRRKTPRPSPPRLRQLAADPRRRRELGETGRRRVEQLYAAPVAFAKLLSLWKETCVLTNMVYVCRVVWHAT